MTWIKNDTGQIVGIALDEEGRQPSKYDLIIEEFLRGEHDVQQVLVKDKSGRYLQTQLARRIRDTGKRERVKAISSKDVAYLIRVYPAPTSVTVV